MRDVIGAPASGLSYSKACNLEDFEHPELRETIRTVFAHEVERFGPEFPRGHEDRKHWEVAMAVRTLTDFGALHQRSRILGVAAGHEPTIFWLTSRAERVFATDLYLEPGIWKPFASETMLTDPASHWPGPWNPRRLVVQHMNALDLQYEDDSFDGIFSSSSIEHFGMLDDVRRAAEEMCRVLKPGGVLSLSTEFRLEGEPPGVPGILLFDAAMIREHIIGGLPWSPVSPLDIDVSAATLQNAREAEDHVTELNRHSERFGEIEWHRLQFSAYPQIVLRFAQHLFTSVHLALLKRPSAA